MCIIRKAYQDVNNNCSCASVSEVVAGESVCFDLKMYRALRQVGQVAVASVVSTALVMFVYPLKVKQPASLASWHLRRISGYAQKDHQPLCSISMVFSSKAEQSCLKPKWHWPSFIQTTVCLSSLYSTFIINLLGTLHCQPGTSSAVQAHVNRFPHLLVEICKAFGCEKLQLKTTPSCDRRKTQIPCLLPD